MILVTRNQKSHFKDIINGFTNFCQQHPVNAEVVSDVKTFSIKKGDAFVVVDDRDLEWLVRYAMDNNLVLGTDLGILSYNETPLKGIVASGITTISTDFAQMGKSMAGMILQQERLKIDNPFVLFKRSSF